MLSEPNTESVLKTETLVITGTSFKRRTQEVSVGQLSICPKSYIAVTT